MVRKGGPNMIRCEDVLRELSNYLDGEVDEAFRRDLEAHVKGCKRCTVLVDSTRKIVRIMADRHIIDLPLGFSERLKARLASGMKEQ